AKILQHSNKLYQIGVAKMQELKFDSAHLFFTQMLNQVTSNEKAYYNRGICYYKMGYKTEACQDWGAAFYYGDTLSHKSIKKFCNGLAIYNGDTIDVNQDDDYRVFDVMPEYPGGEQKLLEFVQKNIKYPHLARENGIQRTVYISFVIGSDGK